MEKSNINRRIFRFFLVAAYVHDVVINLIIRNNISLLFPQTAPILITVKMIDLPIDFLLFFFGSGLFLSPDTRFFVLDLYSPIRLGHFDASELSDSLLIRDAVIFMIETLSFLLTSELPSFYCQRCIREFCLSFSHQCQAARRRENYHAVELAWLLFRSSTDWFISSG